MKLSNIRVVTDNKTFVLIAVRKPPLYVPVFSLSTLARDGDTFDFEKGFLVALARYVYAVPHPQLEQYQARMFSSTSHFITKHVVISRLPLWITMLKVVVAHLSKHHRWWKVFSDIADRSIINHKVQVL